MNKLSPLLLFATFLACSGSSCQSQTSQNTQTDSASQQVNQSENGQQQSACQPLETRKPNSPD